ncbi:MAG TPA: rhodanese-like domain-containing protein [Salinimicrobium sp.]|nr:rhodanese-like domain-containing protein [Salinimicrobium sp.]
MKIDRILPVIALFIVTALSCEAQQKESITVISQEEAKTALAENEDIILLDVRTPEEFDEGAIEGAKNINFFDEDFAEQVNQFDKNKPVYIYCKSGNRSAKAAKQLQEMGFKEIYDIEGGYMNWEK